MRQVWAEGGRITSCTWDIRFKAVSWYCRCLLSTSNPQGADESRRDHVFLGGFTSTVRWEGGSKEWLSTYCGQSTGMYVPLGRESTIVDMV